MTMAFLQPLTAEPLRPRHRQECTTGPSQPQSVCGSAQGTGHQMTPDAKCLEKGTNSRQVTNILYKTDKPS